MSPFSSPVIQLAESSSPIPSRSGETLEEADDPSQSSAFVRLRNIFLEYYPESFSLPSALGTSSVLTRGSEGDRVGLPPMVLSDRAKDRLRLMDSWLEDRLKSAKPKSGLFPPYLRITRARSYQVGEVPGLCASASTGPDFSNLVDSTRRHALQSAKVFYSQAEVDSQARMSYRVFEILSFLEWCLGVFGKFIDQLHEKSVSSSSSSILNEFRDFLLVADRAVGDALGESSVLFLNFVLKKRELFCSFLSKSFVANEKASLLFSPLLKESLFPASTMMKLTTELLGKDTHDSVVRPPSPPPVSFKQRSPLDIPRFRQSTSRGYRRPFRGAKSSRRGLPPTSKKVPKPSKK